MGCLRFWSFDTGLSFVVRLFFFFLFSFFFIPLTLFSLLIEGSSF